SAPPVLADDGAVGDWSMFNYDASGSRFNRGETRLSPQNVGGLHVVWNVATPAPVTGTPAVAGDDLFVGDWGGNFYALDTSRGNTEWQIHLPNPISASALALGSQLFV